MTYDLERGEDRTSEPGNAHGMPGWGPTGSPYTLSWGRLKGWIRAGLATVTQLNAKADASTVPSPATVIPGNTPGNPSRGTGSGYARGDHDHGITPGSGGGGWTYNPQALIDDIDDDTGGDIDFSRQGSGATSNLRGSIRPGSVAAAELAANAVTAAKVADDAIGVAELSATGTPSATTYLRGDNSWATPAGGGNGGGGTGALTFTQVGTALSVGASTAGPALADLAEAVFLKLEYTRTNSDLVFNSLATKTELAGGIRLQLQGGGGAYVDITSDGTSLTLSNANASGYTNITIEFYNVTAAAGPKGDKGDPGSGGGVSILTESRAPVAGDGSDGDFFIRVEGDERAEIWEKIAGTWLQLTEATRVTPNPSGTDGSNLTRLQIGATNWKIPSGGGGGARNVWRLNPDTASDYTGDSVPAGMLYGSNALFQAGLAHALLGTGTANYSGTVSLAAGDIIWGAYYVSTRVRTQAYLWDGTGGTEMFNELVTIADWKSLNSSGRRADTDVADPTLYAWDNTRTYPEGSVVLFAARWWDATQDIPAGAVEPALNPHWAAITPTIQGDATATTQANYTEQITIDRLGFTERLDVGGPIVPGDIVRAGGHDLPAVEHVAWTSGTVPPVTLLSPLEFDLPAPLEWVGLEVMATGGGGGTAPTLNVDLRSTDGTVVSTSTEIDIDGKIRYYQLAVPTPVTTGGYRLTAEALGGSDSGDFTLNIYDILGFSGTNRQGRYVAQIADRILNLDQEANMGITQDEAIALINQLVPPAQRIPPLAGHGGAIPRVTSDASALHLVAPGDIADAVTAEWAQPGQAAPSVGTAFGPYAYQQATDELPPLTVTDTTAHSTHTDTWDPDRVLVDAIRTAKAGDLGRPLQVSGFVDLYITKLDTTLTSGSLQTIYVEFGVKRANGSFQRFDFLVPYIHTTLAEWNQQYAAVGDQVNTYSATPDRTVPVSIGWTIGKSTTWDIRPDDLMALRVEAGSINGRGKAKIVFRDIRVGMPGVAWAS